MCVIWGIKGGDMDGLKSYRDQIQERIDRLEKMEPAFKAMEDALSRLLIDRGVRVRAAAFAALVLADKVSRGK